MRVKILASLVLAMLLLIPIGTSATAALQHKPLIMPIPIKQKPVLNTSKLPHLNNPRNPLVRCVLNLVKKGMTPQEAKRICLQKYRFAVPANRCEAIRKEIKELLNKIARDPKNSRTYIHRLIALREKYKHCVIIQPVFTPAVMNQCEEYEVLTQILNTSKETLDELKYLQNLGEVNKSYVDQFERRVNLIESFANESREFCAKKLAKPPCKELYELQKVKDHIIQIKNITNTTNPQLEEIEKRIDSNIVHLRKVCIKIPLAAQVKEVKGIKDANYIYEGMINGLIANITEGNYTEEQLVSQIKKIENERKELIRSFIARMKELNLEKQTLVRKLKIGKRVEAEGVPTNITKVNLVIGNQTITLTPGGTVKIIVSNETAESEIELELINNTLVDPQTNKTIKILPTHIRKRFKKALIKRILLKRLKSKPVYEVEAQRKGKFLGLIPVTFSIKEDVDATDGSAVATIKPWWSIFVV